MLPFTKPGVWLFPNLFADVGFIDSFIPVWGWHGVDYEKMHIEKYRKQNAAKRKKKTKGDRSLSPERSLDGNAANDSNTANDSPVDADEKKDK
jgi:translocation protein SEC62